MTSHLVRQASFVGGEIAPLAYGKTDSPAYQHGLRTALNFIPTLEGPIVNRPGTRYVCAVKDSSYSPLLVGFSFADGQNFILEIGDLYIRFVQDGAQVLFGNGGADWDAGTAYAAGAQVEFEGYGYVSLQNGNTGHVPVDSPTWWEADDSIILEVVAPWLSADLDRLNFAQSGDIITVTHPSYAPREIARVSNTEWTVTEVSFSPQAYFAGRPRIGNVPAMLGTVAQWGGLAGITGVSVATHLWRGAATYGLGEFVLHLEATGGAGYHLYQSTIAGNANSEPSSSNRNWYDWTYYEGGAAPYSSGNYAWLASEKKMYIAQGEIDGDAGAGVSIPPPAAPWAAACDDTRPGKIWQYVVTQVWRDALGGTHETAASEPTQALQLAIYTDRPTTILWDGEFTVAVGDRPESYVILGYNVYRGRNGIYGFVGAAAPMGSRVFGSFNDDGEPPNYGKQPPRGTNPFDYATAAGTKTQSWPGAFTYHEQRGVFARSDVKPQDFWGSALGQPKNFDVNTPVQDTDSYNWKPGSERLEEIRGLLSLRYLLLFTGAGVWGAYGGANGTIGPSSIHLRRYLQQGASYLHALAVDRAALFYTARGRVMDLNWDYRSDMYVGRDVSVVARHLFENHTIIDWAYAEVPYGVVWAIRDDGVLLSFTYVPGVAEAWARHTTKGAFERVQTIIETDAETGVSEDAVYVQVRRFVNGFAVRYIERFSTRVLRQQQVVAFDLQSTFTDDVRKSNFLDCSLEYDGRATTGSITLTGASYDGGDSLACVASASFIPPTTRGFQASDIGSSIVVDPNGLAGGPIEATITAVADALNATVQLDANLPAAFQNVALTDIAFAPAVLTGLDHLEGMAVNALLDGAVAGPFTVTGGEITPGGPAVIAQVGLGYNSDLELLDLAASEVKSNVKSVRKVIFEVVASRGILAGERLTDTLFAPQLQAVEGGNQAPLLTTGLVEVPIGASWNSGARACLRQEDPLPLTVTAMIRELVLGGR